MDKKRKLGDIEMTIASYNKQHKQYVTGMDKYIDSLKKMPPEAAKKEAKRSLIRSGVLTTQGNPKKKICK